MSVFRKRWWLLSISILILGLLGTRELPPRYTNSDGSVVNKSFVEVLSWRLRVWMDNRPDSNPSPVAVVRDPRVFGTSPAPTYAATWMSHASVLLHLAGTTVLTDPQFSERASPVTWAGPKRQQAPPYALSELPHIDVVLISHNHYDHLDLPSLHQLALQPGGPPLFVVPAGVEQLLADEGIPNVRALDWWSDETMGGLKITSVPANHWSARSLWDRNQTHWGGWVVQDDCFSAYFAGDTGYSQDFVEIGRRLGPFDLALIPVGAYEPRDFMRAQHVNPADAVQIHRDVHARLSIGIHWGTFQISDDSLDAPKTALPDALQAAGLPDSEFVLLRLGEMRPLKVQRLACTGKTAR